MGHSDPVIRRTFLLVLSPWSRPIRLRKCENEEDAMGRRL